MVFPDIFTKLYGFFAPWLKIFERSQPYRETEQLIMPEDAVPLIILIGLGRYGTGITHTLRERGWRVIAVDFNPDLVRLNKAAKDAVVFGDAEDPEFIATLPLDQAHWVVSTAREGHVNRSLIHTLQNLAYRGHIAIAAQAPEEVARLEHAGADLVLLPFADAAREAADRIIELDLLELPAQKDQ